MKYRLKKDLPWAKAGTVVEADFEKSGNGNISYCFTAEWGRDKGKRVYHGWYPYMYETFSDWFEEVDERWKPEKGEKYWMVATWTGEVTEHVWGENDLSDKWLMHAMNVFRTKELATSAAEEIKALLKEFHKNNV